MRDHAGRIALHYVCTYNGSKHQGRQLYAGAPVEATRIVRAHVARCTTSRAASPSRNVPEHSIAKSVRVRVCVVRCVFLRARTTYVYLCVALLQARAFRPPMAISGSHSALSGCSAPSIISPEGSTQVPWRTQPPPPWAHHTHTHTHTHAHTHTHTTRARRRGPAGCANPSGMQRGHLASRG